MHPHEEIRHRSSIGTGSSLSLLQASIKRSRISFRLSHVTLFQHAPGDNILRIWMRKLLFTPPPKSNFQQRKSRLTWARRQRHVFRCSENEMQIENRCDTISSMFNVHSTLRKAKEMPFTSSHAIFHVNE